MLNNIINNATSVVYLVASGVIKLAREVAEHGILGGKLDEEITGGEWQTMAKAINSMAAGKSFLEQYVVLHLVAAQSSPHGLEKLIYAGFEVQSSFAEFHFSAYRANTMGHRRRK
jgi:hypothetical protein